MRNFMTSTSFSKLYCVFYNRPTMVLYKQKHPKSLEKNCHTCVIIGIIRVTSGLHRSSINTLISSNNNVTAFT